MWLLCLPLPVLVHEAAHWMAAKVLGTSIRFEFSWGKLGKIPVPRWTWRWPDTTPLKLRVICLAGFAAEMALIPFLPLAYWVVAMVHFVLYPFYAKDNNDWAGVI
jgi:hypothetical protein